MGAEPVKIQSAIEAALERPIREIAQFDAAGLIAARVSSLELFTGPGMPAEIADSYRQAIEVTKVGGEIAAQCLAIFEMAQLIPHYETQHLYMLAKASIDHDEVQPNPRLATSPEVIAKNRQIRADILSAILQRLSEHDVADSLGQIVAAAFAEREKFDRYIAGVQATMLQAAKDRLTLQLQAARAAAYYALIWRYVFYRAVVEEVGSALENETRRAKSLDLLGELGLALAGKVTQVGEFIELAKQLFQVVDLLAQKARAMHEMATDMAARQRLAKEYVLLYQTAVLGWCERAVVVNRVLSETIADFSNVLTAATEYLQAGSPPAS